MLVSGRVATPLKFNSSPPLENGWLEDIRLSFWGPVFFQGRAVKLPGGNHGDGLDQLILLVIYTRSYHLIFPHIIP